GRQVHRGVRRLHVRRSVARGGDGGGPSLGVEHVSPLGRLATGAGPPRGAVMEQAVLTEPGGLSIERRSAPKPGPHEVLVRVGACGLCGTDRAIFRGDHPSALPIVLGHEFAGTVVECGSEVFTLEVGARISVDPNVVCGRCRFCRKGLVNHCRHLTPLGVALPGGFAEYAVVPESNAYRLRDSTSFDDGALV